MRPEVTERDLGRERVLDEARRRRRQQDLPTVGDRRDPCRPVDLVADEARGGLGGLAGVDAHAHAQQLARRPRVAGECPLDLEGRGEAGARGREGREE